MIRNTAAGIAGSEFLYNANRSRVMQPEYDHVNAGQAADHNVRKRI